MGRQLGEGRPLSVFALAVHGVAPLVVVQAGPLGKRLVTKVTAVGFVSGVDSAVGLEGGRLSEGLSADLTAVGSGSDVSSHVGHQRGLVSETVGTNAAGEGSLVGVALQVVPQVHSCLELLVTLLARKISNIFMMGFYVSLESTRFAETFVAKFTPDLSPNAVGPQVIPQGIPVRVAFITHIAFGLVALVGTFVNPGSRPVAEPGRTPVTKVLAIEEGIVAGVARGTFGGPVDVGRHRVPKISNFYYRQSKLLQILTKPFYLSWSQN